MPTYATFPGLSKIVGASFTMSHGTSPSSGTIITMPHTESLPFYGNLEIVDENHGTFIRLFDCVVETATLTGSTTSAQLWNLRVLDRRWKWRFGQISGHYNEPLRENEWRREKTPQELANLLFQAMGETTHEVAELPNESRPHVVWELANPADELSRLCEGLGCRVILSLSDNRARIVKRNVGAPLPVIGKEVSLTYALARKAAPDNVTIVTGESRYEGIWKLEAIGEETDGSYKPIEELSYMPTWWTKDPGQFPYFLNVTDDFERDGKTIENRTLAQRSVFRMYRVKESVGVEGLAPPSFQSHFPGESVDSLEQLTFYPFLNDLVEENQGEIEKKYKPAVIMGVYFPLEGSSINNLPLTQYRDTWALDGSAGIVMFTDFIYKYSGDDNFPIAPADLWLHCTAAVRSKDLGINARYSQQYGREASLGTPDLFVERPELVLRTSPSYIWYTDRVELSNATDNRQQIEIDSLRIAQQKIREFAQDDAGTMVYAGIWPINLDGALEQVSWSFSATQPALTSLGRQMEVEMPLIGYNAKRSKQLAEHSSVKQEIERQTVRRPDMGGEIMSWNQLW